MNLTQKNLKLINELPLNTSIIIACSGGPDSMCLMDILYKKKEEKNLTLICAHVNHNVRKESKKEEKFVKEYALAHGFIFESMLITNYTKENFESDARKKRYTFFDELVKKYNADYVMTAHHVDDLTETILMRLTRGSYLSGYIGFKEIAKQNGYYLARPLIHFTKEQILAYNKENKITYVTDQSNNTDEHTRNRFRHHILPLLKKENPKVCEKFLEFSEEMMKIDAFLEKYSIEALHKVYNNGKLNNTEFNHLDAIIQERVLESILKEIYQNDINCITKKHRNLIFSVLKKEGNKKITLPRKILFCKEYCNSYFTSEKSNEKVELELKENSTIPNIGTFKFLQETTEKSNFVIKLNSKEIALPLKIRTRKNGDFIEVKNLKGRKKVSDIFTDEKISPSKRDSIPILVDNSDQILWIPGRKKSKFDKNNDEFYDIIIRYEKKEDVYAKEK